MGCNVHSKSPPDSLHRAWAMPFTSLGVAILAGVLGRHGWSCEYHVVQTLQLVEEMRACSMHGMCNTIWKPIMTRNRLHCPQQQRTCWLSCQHPAPWCLLNCL
jgi:hypothetical protein